MKPGRRDPLDEDIVIPEIPGPETDPRLRIPDVLRQEPGPPKGGGGAGGSSLGELARAWAVAFDFVATVIGGLALGWLFDWWRGTQPWGMLVGLAMGFASALIRIIRRTLKEEAAAARKKKSG